MGHSRQEGGFAEAPQQPIDYGSARPIAGALGPLRPEFMPNAEYIPVKPPKARQTPNPSGDGSK